MWKRYCFINQEGKGDKIINRIIQSLLTYFSSQSHLLKLWFWRTNFIHLFQQNSWCVYFLTATYSIIPKSKSITWNVYMEVMNWCKKLNDLFLNTSMNGFSFTLLIFTWRLIAWTKDILFWVYALCLNIHTYIIIFLYNSALLLLLIHTLKNAHQLNE